jgi:hypothetical protein
MSLFSRIFRITLGSVAALALSISMFGCTGTNNDQGTSFQALGFFLDGSGASGQLGSIVFLNESSPSRSAEGLSQVSTPLFIPSSIGPNGVQGGYIGLENMLTSQFIRTVGANCSYSVPGADASLTIPSDSWFFTTVLGPAEGGEGTGTSSSRGNVAFAQIVIVSPDVIQFLSVNQNRLPALPFRMLVECDVTGISQSGNVLTTNPVHFQIIFDEFPECCSASENDPGFQTGAGTGGDLSVASDS